jgi:hypothetical protein
MAHKLIQPVAPLQDVKEGQAGLIGGTQRDIQIPQAHIAVDAKHTLPGAGQRRRHGGGYGRFARPALTGQDRDRFSHVYGPPMMIFFHYKGIITKKQEEFT